MKRPKYITLVLLLVIAALSGTLLYMMVANAKDNASRERDVVRIMDLSQIRHALDQYKSQHGYYPVCLYRTGNCLSLEGTVMMSSVPTDPLTNLPYSYASIGSGTACVRYHVGTSLERRLSQSLLTGSDAPPVSSQDLCKGSQPDFSGLSYAPGGQPCSPDLGIAQPTDDPKGESCYDLKGR